MNGMTRRPATAFGGSGRIRLLTCCAIAICSHAAGCGPRETVVTLRGADGETRYFAPTGPCARQFVSRGPKGWTISVTSESPTDAVGLLAKAVIHGDFRLEAAYEIEVLNRPLTGSGVGPSLYVATDDAANTAAQLARLERTQEGPVVSSALLSSDSRGKRRRDLAFAPHQATAGRLRLDRRGTRMTFSVKEHDRDWTELRQVEFGDRPVTMLRVALERGGAATTAVIHWTEISLHLADLPLAWNSSGFRRLLFIGGAVAFPICLAAFWMIYDTLRFQSARRPANSASPQ